MYRESHLSAHGGRAREAGTETKMTEIGQRASYVRHSPHSPPAFLMSVMQQKVVPALA